MKNTRLDGWLVAGIVTFGVFVVSHLAELEIAIPAACVGLAIAAAAGYRRASVDSFFTGMALGLVAWIVLLFVFKPVEAWHMLFMFVPVNFIVGFVMGAVGFLAGRLALRLFTWVRRRG